MENSPENTSIHLTFNFDTHVWELNYLSARRLALTRAGVSDISLGQDIGTCNKYVGKVNTLPRELHTDLFSNLSLDFCDDTKDMSSALDETVTELKRISMAIDENTFNAIPAEIWSETVKRLQEHGLQLFEIHRDMYLAAIEEGRKRKNEKIMMKNAIVQSRAMTPERMQRLSLFRVQKYFEQIAASKSSLHQWSEENFGAPMEQMEMGISFPLDWASTFPLKVGDQVEADLGGAYFPATVTKVGNYFEVRFFDGDVMNGLNRNMIRLLVPPTSALNGETTGADEEPPPRLTKKELKRWLKNKEKKSGKK